MASHLLFHCKDVQGKGVLVVLGQPLKASPTAVRSSELPQRCRSQLLYCILQHRGGAQLRKTDSSSTFSLYKYIDKANGYWTFAMSK